MGTVSNKELDNAANGIEETEEVIEEVVEAPVEPVDKEVVIETPSEVVAKEVEEEEVGTPNPIITAPVEVPKEEVSEELSPAESTRLGRKLAAQAERLETALKRIEELESKPVIPQKDEYDFDETVEDEGDDKVLTVAGFKALQDEEKASKQKAEKTYRDNYVGFIDNKDIVLEEAGNEEALVLHDLVVARMANKAFTGTFKGEGQSDAERNYNLAQTQILNEQISQLKTQNANPEKKIPVIGKRGKISTGVGGDSNVEAPKGPPALEIKDEDTKNLAAYLTSQGVTDEEMNETLTGETPMQLKKTIG